jgi:uncharacterized protein YkwD
MAMANMNRITISLIFLIVISMVLPTSAIMYASGQSTDNSDDSSTGGPTTDNSGSSSTGGPTTDNSGSSTGGGSTTTTTDNSGSSTGGGSTTTTTDNSGSSTGTSTDNSATLPTTSTASNNTGNTQGMDVNGILTVHNQERAAVGVPPLIWSDSLAASAQTWANQLLATGKFQHSGTAPGESIAFAYLDPLQPQPQLAQSWADQEKKNYHAGELVTGDNYQTFGHYTQMVWKNTKEVGCGFASGPGGVYAEHGGTQILVCQYRPGGNVIGQAPY